MTEPPDDLSPGADAIRAAEREAIRRYARTVASQAARAAGYRDAADVSVGFIDMVLGEAFAARDAEIEGMRRARDRSEPPA